MRNVQRRHVDAPADVVGALVDRVASPDDVLWPSGWPPLVLDAGLAPGSQGGHGPMRYGVAEYEPGRRLRFRFAPGSGVEGHHELLVVPDGPGRCEIRHTIEATTSGRMRVLWPLVVRWFHEALTQDLLDNAERAAAGGLHGPAARWSRWVRVLRWVRGRRG